MSPKTGKSKRWRELHQTQIIEWRNKIDRLRVIANLECWSYERLEIEIAQLLPSDLREIFDFSTYYIRRYKKGGFRKYMNEVAAELFQHGTLEPSRLITVKKAIATTKRRMREKK